MSKKAKLTKQEKADAFDCLVEECLDLISSVLHMAWKGKKVWWTDKAAAELASLKALRKKSEAGEDVRQPLNDFIDKLPASAEKWVSGYRPKLAPDDYHRCVATAEEILDDWMLADIPRNCLVDYYESNTGTGDVVLILQFYRTQDTREEEPLVEQKVVQPEKICSKAVAAGADLPELTEANLHAAAMKAFSTNTPTAEQLWQTFSACMQQFPRIRFHATTDRLQDLHSEQSPISFEDSRRMSFLEEYEKSGSFYYVDKPDQEGAPPEVGWHLWLNLNAPYEDRHCVGLTLRECVDTAMRRCSDLCKDGFTEKLR